MKKAFEVLYTTEHVRKRIRSVMASAGRRVAVTAFVGDHAEAYVSKARGLELYCWPQGGATSEKALRRLMSKGTTVRFVDRLHMKVYWSAARGAVVASANLSTNALGAGGLKESGVYIPRGLDIERILRGLAWREATASELETLKKQNIASKTQRRAGAQSGQTFLEWYRTRARARWWLSVVQGYAPSSKRARQVAREDRGASDVEDAVTVGRGTARAEDFILLLDCTKGTPSAVDWLYVHRVVAVERSEKAYQRGLSRQAVQVYPRSA